MYHDARGSIRHIEKKGKPTRFDATNITFHGELTKRDEPLTYNQQTLINRADMVRRLKATYEEESYAFERMLELKDRIQEERSSHAKEYLGSDATVPYVNRVVAKMALILDKPSSSSSSSSSSTVSNDALFQSSEDPTMAEYLSILTQLTDLHKKMHTKLPGFNKANLSHFIKFN